MSKLKIDVEVDSLSELDLIDVNKYQFVVKFLKDGGILPLDHPSIPNTATVQVTTTTPIFSIEIDNITAMNDVMGVVKVFNNSESDCCVASESFYLTVEGGGGVDPETGVYELLMNTTGNGLDPSTPSGIMQEWVDSIEAFHYDWGWGITGISICVQWYVFEPTEGNYNFDVIQKNIDYCNARGLSLSYKFWPLRKDNDPMIHESEKQVGALGQKLYTADEIMPSYGCDRTNAIIYNTVRALAGKLSTYSRAGHLLAAGGNTEELVYASPFNGTGPLSQSTDFSDDNKARFNAWVAARGLVAPGEPPHRSGVAWPGPDFSQPLGVEWGRFLTYSMRKFVDNFAAAVKSVSNLKTLYFYAACGGGQMPSTNNPNFNFIAANCDGMYGSDGNGLWDYGAKFLVNAINNGTFPGRISAVEFDVQDASEPYGNNEQPPYCWNQVHYGMMKDNFAALYNKGANIIHYAMKFCPTEIAGMRDILYDLHQTHIGKPYVPPVLNAGNTVTVDVTERYRTGENYLWNVNPQTQYVKITDDNFFGGVTPFVE